MGILAKQYQQKNIVLVLKNKIQKQINVIYIYYISSDGFCVLVPFKTIKVDCEAVTYSAPIVNEHLCWQDILISQLFYSPLLISAQ